MNTHLFSLAYPQRIIFPSVLCLLLGVLSVQAMSPDQEATLRSRQQKTNMGFVENRGQLTDMALTSCFNITLSPYALPRL